MKILTIIGARPQFIKAAALSKRVQEMDHVEEILVHTGQHYDPQMSAVFFEQLKIPKPKYTFKGGGKSHGEMTGYLIAEIEKIIILETPDCVLVYGDTNSTLAGAIAASKLHIPIAHVEAGLRSFNMQMPEEVNRILTDRVSRFLFCPTTNAMEHLDREGFDHWEASKYLVGDIMYDVSLMFQEYLPDHSPLEFPFTLGTVHRAENTDSPEVLDSIIQELNAIAADIHIVLPLHPRTRKVIERLGIPLHLNIEVLEPLPYLDFMHYLKFCTHVFSDSGGLQKEAYFMKKNCFVLREETEWTELIDSNHNVLVPPSAKNLSKVFKKREQLNHDFSKNIYGQGNSAELILNILLKHLSESE